jgi:hypothetical protein
MCPPTCKGCTRDCSTRPLIEVISDETPARSSGSRVAASQIGKHGHCVNVQNAASLRFGTDDCGRTALSGQAADWRKHVLDSLQAMSLLTIMEIIGPILLFAVLIYGTMQWSRRRRGPTQAVREASTRELYREGARAEKREEAGEASAGGKPTFGGKD